MKIEVTLSPGAARDLDEVMQRYALGLDDAVALLIIAGACELTPNYVERLMEGVRRHDTPGEGDRT